MTGHPESTTLPLMSDRRRELEDLQRQQVEADLDILRGLQRRAQLARRIGELGPQGGPPDMREQVAQLIRLAGDELSAEIVGSVFRQVHAATSSLERPARIAFAGPEGGFSSRRRRTLRARGDLHGGREL